VFFRDGLLYPVLVVLPGNFLFVHRRRVTNIFDLDEVDWLRDGSGARRRFRTGHDGTRTYPGQGCCVPLTIDGADPDRMFILAIGGSANLEPTEDSLTTDSVEVFRFRRDDPASSAWGPLAPLPDRRFMCDGVLLADGTVFVTSGAGKGKADKNSGDRLASYVFEPVNNAWRVMADSLRLRAYHSIALLLPDARVLVAGSTGHDFLEREDEFRLDVFTPPYLTRGARPVVAEAPAEFEPGDELTIRVGGFSASNIVEVALMRPGSTTHSVNMDQRRVLLPIRERSGTTVRVGTPASRAVIPRGFYMLFVLNLYGVPSEAAWVRAT
ncbi:MAG TPA: galactose oxidase early set domain-containing protein, partial [Methylomirabilota bacterium]|nr:galactose oxidase early set domain-containing protein [Methylomirabilota bacterium]